MLLRPPSVFKIAPATAMRQWLACLVIPLLACSATASAQELVRAPGWIAVLPNDSQPVMPEVRLKGSEWHVDAVRGDDLASGSKKQPWKTLARLKRVGLSSGDVVRLKCGGVWREALDMDARAFPPGLTVAAEEGCGPGQAPSIRGSDLVNAAWGVDSAQANVSVADRFGVVNGLFYKGQTALLARFPDQGGVGREFALADGLKSQRSFRLREKERLAVGERDLVGANVYVRVHPWQVEKATVRSYDASAGVVTLSKDLSAPVLNGAGYILEGKRWMLNAPGEWWHDTQAKRLYLITPDGQRPKAADVAVVVRDHAVRVNNASQLRVMGLDLRQTSQTALDVHDVNDVAFDGLSIADPGEYGVVIYRSGRVAFRGSRIERSGWHAVLTREAPDAVVSDNVILDHGLMGRAGGSAGAIAVKGERTVVSGNLVQRAANSGIHFFNLEGTQVTRNRVIQPCIRLTDCGGIQTWTGDSPSLATRKPVTRSVVKDNVVLGGAGNLEGSSGRGFFQSNGIYFDSMTGGVQAVDNVIAGMENGFYIHNAQFNTVTGNTVRSVTHASVTAHMSIPGADAVRGNRVKGNRLFSSPPIGGGDEVFAFKWQQPNDPDNLFAGGDANEVQDNQILRLGSTGQTRWYVGENHTARSIAEGAWRKFAKQDREQVIAGAPASPRRFGKEGQSMLPDGDFKSGKLGWQAYFNPAGQGGLVAAQVCNGAPCLRFMTGHASDSLSSKPFRMESEPGKNKHVLRFTIKMGPKGGSLRVAVRRDGPPFDSFGLDQSAMKMDAAQVMRVELPFLATNSDPARLFISLEPGVEVHLSNASITRVQEPAVGPMTDARSLFIVNLSKGAQSISCADTLLPDCAALDEQGQDVKWPLSLPVGQGRAVFPRQPLLR